MKRAAVLLTDGFETIEALTVVDVFRRAGIETVTLGVSGKQVKSAQGIFVQTDSLLKDWREKVDAVVLPGGMAPGAAHLAKVPEVRALIEKTDREEGLIGAICAAPACVLAPTGILNGKRATCYPGMENRFDASTVYVDQDVVVDGRIVTSQGPGTSLAFAFALAAKLVGQAKADDVARGMLFLR